MSKCQAKRNNSYILGRHQKRPQPKRANLSDTNFQRQSCVPKKVQPFRHKFQEAVSCAWGWHGHSLGGECRGRVRVSIDLLSPLSRSSHPLSHTFVLGGQISSDEFNHPAANGYDNLCPHLVFIKFALPLFISVTMLNFPASSSHITCTCYKQYNEL